LPQVVAHARKVQKRFSRLIVEGAGGLLSPLGDNFDSRGLIKALDATPVIVCPNHLGAINQVLLVLAALSPRHSRSAKVVLISERKPDSSAHDNPIFLRQKLGARVHVLPWLKNPERLDDARKDRRIAAVLQGL
jgi:dethiobiotin synthetase